MENEIDEEKYFASLKNRIWKLLPIFEGKGMDRKIVYSREEAYEKYQLYLLRVLSIYNKQQSKTACANHQYPLTVLLLQNHLCSTRL